MHGRLARWLKFIAEYKFEISHLQGENHVIVNYLSRYDGVDRHKNEGKNICISQFLADE